MSNPKPLILEDQFVTVAVRREVAKAIEGVVFGHIAELDAALAPFGLRSSDIAVPEWARIVTEYDIASPDDMPPAWTEDERDAFLAGWDEARRG